MSVSRSSALARALSRPSNSPARPYTLNSLPRPLFYRQFHVHSRRLAVKPFLLADIGEGITECQLIQWFVQPGARVEQFDKLCEVQSDKASVEITSPFDGVIKKLHYEPDEMAITGKPLVDIDIQGEISEADEAKIADTPSGKDAEERADVEAEGVGAAHVPEGAAKSPKEQPQQPQSTGKAKGDMSALATPAVRHLVKEHGLRITDIQGTGKDGRVLKEDVHRHVAQGQQPATSPSSTQVIAPSREDRQVPLTPVQNMMFKSMTRSLNIPHFLYTSSADMTGITSLRKKLNAAATPDQKLTHLAFIMKAVSIAFNQHPILNASLDTSDAKKPQLTHRGAHNFGVAIDGPSGLVVPVVKNVQDLSIREIASTLKQLSEKAKINKLAPQDFSGATFTVSNIGSVGGGVVSPVISEPQVAIVGVGRSKVVPAFGKDGELIKKEELVLSWSADHRVVDGAECARCAEKVNSLLEDPAAMLVDLR